MATYLSFDHEFSTASLIQAALQLGKRVCVPRTYPQGRMEFVEYDPDILEKRALVCWSPMKKERLWIKQRLI